MVAERSVYHDVAGDVLTDFHPWLPSVYFPSDEGLLSAGKKYAETAKRPILFGTIATGEFFVENQDRERIRQYCASLAADMETAGAAPCVLCEPDPLFGGKEHYRYQRGQRGGSL